MTSRNLMGSGLSLLSSIGVGAALMYLMDPQLGRARRRLLKAAAGNALHETSEKFTSGLQNAAERARGLREELTERLTPEQARYLGRRLSRRMRQSFSQPTIRTGTSAFTLSLVAVGSLAAGAGLMYFFDPERGPDRRTALSNRVRNATTQASQSVRDVSRQWRGRAQEMAAELRQRASFPRGEQQPPPT